MRLAVKLWKHGFLVKYQFMMLTLVKRILQNWQRKSHSGSNQHRFLMRSQERKKQWWSSQLVMIWKKQGKSLLIRLSLLDKSQVVNKRNLNYNQEIGLRWSVTKAVEKLEFSVLYVPRLDSSSLRISKVCGTNFRRMINFSLKNEIEHT